MLRMPDLPLSDFFDLIFENTGLNVTQLFEHLVRFVGYPFQADLYSHIRAILVITGGTQGVQIETHLEAR